MRKLVIGLALLGASGPALAQPVGVETRVEKLESQMRAVQRKVFPGGDARFFEPQITAPTPAPSPGGAPADTPVSDLTQRVAALEGQLQTLTGQVEQNQFKLRQLEQGAVAFETRLKALEGGGQPAVDAAPETTPSAASAPAVIRPAAATAAAAPDPAALSPERQAALDAIAFPATGDAGDDAYSYGFRLWQARFYPQARAQLSKMIADHPRHSRVSYARNLIGRAWLDEGMPNQAGKAFYENYEKLPGGDRAAESLYYFGVSLIRADKSADACRVFEEFDTVYGPIASTTLKRQVGGAKVEARCS